MEEREGEMEKDPDEECEDFIICKEEEEREEEEEEEECLGILST